MSGNVCDCCGKSDLPTVVCCSALGAASFAYCILCHGMGAEPPGLAKGMEVGQGICCEYRGDRYYEAIGGEYIPIKLVDGTELQTRSEYVAWKREHGSS